MASRSATPIVSEDIQSGGSIATSGSSLPSAFSRMMAPQPVVQSLVQRDKFARPIPRYNENYDPFRPANPDIPKTYSPYDYGEPLFDDREALVARLPIQHTLAAPPKKPRTAWVWKIGYALTDNGKNSKPTIWACKLCKCKCLLLGILADNSRSPRSSIFEEKGLPFQ